MSLTEYGIIPECEIARADELARLRAENQGLMELIALTYGLLWMVNNERGTPNQNSPESMAHRARRTLRDLMTTDQRAAGINAAREAVAKERKE